ncbi:MAG: flavin reductase family protein [Chloroflexota bacterium]
MMNAPKLYQYFATTVNLLTSCNRDGKVNVMACEWTMNVSFNPFKVLCVVGTDKLTHTYITESKEFGVNLCADTQASLSHFVGDVSGRDVDKLSDSGFAGLVYDSTHIKPPMIRGCILNAECVVEEMFQMGKYTGFLGLSRATTVDTEARPLFYHRGKYFQLGAQIPKSQNDSKLTE